MPRGPGLTYPQATEFAPPQPEEPAEPRLAHPWLIAVLVAAAWWPISTFWQSDDWIALHYAADPGRALSDLWGNQYGLGGAVWFYRPLVTLSFAIDAAIGGGAPFVAHLSNALALGVAAMLLGMLVTRFLGRAAGFWAAIVWGTSPVHAGSVVWAVGRVDSHCVPWMLLSALLLVRYWDGHRKTRALALLAFGAALCTKELAFAMPGIAAVLCAAMGQPGRRLRAAVTGSWPFFVVLAGCLLWRFVLLGHFIGGYTDSSIDPASQLTGWGIWTQRELNPLSMLTADGLAPLDVDTSWLAWWWIGFAPAAAGAIWLLRARPRCLLVLGLLYAGCSIPSVQFWSYTDNPQNLRYFTLPFAALAAVLAAGRAWTAIPALAIAALPHLEVRRDYLDAAAEARRVHRLLVEHHAELEPGPVFVWGLPRQTRKHVLTFHLGVDRLLLPPFAEGERRVFALRPLSPRADAPRLPYGETKGLAHGHTLALMDDTGAFVLEPDRRPRIDAVVEGPDHLTSQVLTDISQDRTAPAFVLGGERAEHYRITLFTAGGYVTCVLPNEAAAGESGGRVAVRRWLEAETTSREYVVKDLRIPTALDLDLRFPVLIEAGALVRRGERTEFAATAVGRDFVWLRFDRDYAAFMAP